IDGPGQLVPGHQRLAHRELAVRALEVVVQVRTADPHSADAQAHLTHGRFGRGPRDHPQVVLGGDDDAAHEIPHEGQLRTRGAGVGGCKSGGGAAAGPLNLVLVHAGLSAVCGPISGGPGVAATDSITVGPGCWRRYGKPEPARQGEAHTMAVIPPSTKMFCPDTYADAPEAR